MMLLNRRSFLRGSAGVALSTVGVGAYATGVEPLMVDITSYHLTPPGWPDDLPLKIAILADIHACDPWMTVHHIRHICQITNGLEADLIVLLGDYNAGHNLAAPVMPDQWGDVLKTLRAPLGVYGILGNHDVWHGALPNMRGDGGHTVKSTLVSASVHLLDNKAVRVTKDGKPFWLLGLADQLAFRLGKRIFRGADDLPGTLRQVTDTAPAILLAHEPYIFPDVPKRICLTLSGHTHGGQVNLPFLGSPVAVRQSPYVYGHIVEDDRHLLISAGLGASFLPIRFMRPPEIVELTLGGPASKPAALVRAS